RRESMQSVVGFVAFDVIAAIGLLWPAAALLLDATLAQLDSVLAESIHDCLALDGEGNPCVEARTPLELEREIFLPGGHIFHGDLAFPYREAADDSPAARWGVASGHANILLCGAGAVRGGGVSGIGGHNAAMAVLEEGSRLERD
ncbi:hypothetical protein ACWELQ_03340, partial [Nocardia sp. NPDC004722]